MSNTSTEQSGTKGSDESSGISYALIHEASSLTNFSNLDDPESVESKIARSRGKSRVEGKNKPAEEDGNEPATYQVESEEGRIKVDTGYVVRFVDEDLTHLTPMDVKGIDSLKDYPAPEDMIDDLPPRIRGHLKEHGFVKIRGAYSQEESRFYGVQLGWEAEETPDPWDRLMEVISQVSSATAAVDYVYVEEGPERWDAEEVAACRGIEVGSVRGNVRSVSNELDR